MKKAKLDTVASMDLFNAIVSSTPAKVVEFFDRLKSLRERKEFHPVVRVLNTMIENEHHEWIHNKGDEPVMMKWFEIFRDIYIAKKLADAPEGQIAEATFTFFARTFEPLHLSPQFWFADTNLIKKSTFMAKAEAFRLAFERYLCASGGGHAWGAIDWEMESFAERKVRGGLQNSGKEALHRLAAIALTARAVLRAELNLSIDLRDEVSLPFAGLSNEKGNTCGLLQYFHFDNVTKLSFARARELGEEWGDKKDHVKFEPRWDAMTVLADTILKKSHARATVEAARRVMADTCLEFADLVCDDMKQFEKKHPDVFKAAKKLQTLFEEPLIKTLRESSENDLLKMLGVRDGVMPSDWYLTASNVNDPAFFWKEAMKIFKKFVANFDLIYNQQAPLYSKVQLEAAVMKSVKSNASESVKLLEKMLRSGHLNGIENTLYPNALSAALKELIARKVIEFNPTQLADVLAVENMAEPKTLIVRHCESKVTSEISFEKIIPNAKPGDFKAWVLGGLNALGIATYKEPPSKHGRGGKKSSAYDYTRRDFAESVKLADSLWNDYFSERSEDCLKRYRLSILKADELLKNAMDGGELEVKSDESGTVGKLTKKKFLLKEYREKLKQELAEMEGRYGIRGGKDELEKYVDELMKQDTVVNKSKNGEVRVLIMMALIARIMVETAGNYAELWRASNKNMLVAFIMHMLTATMKDSAMPFPWHLGWFTGSYMRAKLGRMKDRQWNVIDRWIQNAEFDDMAQKEILTVFLMHYLRETSNAHTTVGKMMKREVIRNWIGDERLEYLKSQFEGK